MCKEAMLGISLYSFLYLKNDTSYYLLCFLFSKIGEQEGRTGSSWKGEGVGQLGGKGEKRESWGKGGPNNIYTYE
jgi:hypothetical protein